ncbi:hypothetical protein AVEN_883-1 [Araneus ventricosus]|uniref:Uncharacterized protein n=1 Tax=Araneus ventricosus TaxID=182803 RepID=A0A4Y2DSA9_ARAVE|nr:hypothetical protein AVEN_883-1 [Araneus ventricosus]
MFNVKLESEGFSVKQARVDADHLIVTSAIAAEEEHKMCCASRGRHRCPHHTYSISIPGKGNSPNNLFSASSFKYSYSILFYSFTLSVVVIRPPHFTD